MDTTRHQKALSQRLDVDAHRRPRALRNWRRGLTALALVAAASYGLWALVEAPAHYQAGPLSAAHQFIAHDCRQCHTEDWQTLGRLVQFSERPTSTPNSACVACHAGALHHELQVDRQQQCVDCHREHRGHSALATIGDGRCVACHGELQTTQGPSSTFARRIRAWSEHPEFAVLRGNDALPPPEKHGVHQVARHEPPPSTLPGGAVDPLFALRARLWSDRTALRFNHWAHLKPEGVLLNDRRTRETLRCEACHVVDEAGGHMRPVTFDQHCARCHAGQLLPEMAATPEHPASLPGFELRPVPHAAPEVVRGAMRERYADFIRARPEQLAAIVPAEQGDPLGGLLSRVDASKREEVLAGAWVERRLTQLDDKLFHAAGSCRYCHRVEVQASAAGRRAEVRIEPVRMPRQWWSHARFRHEPHRLLDCRACHAEATQSRFTEHVLLPGIGVCRNCHAEGTNVAASARTDCVECHDYHPHRGASLDGGLGLDLKRIDKPPTNGPAETP